MLNENSQREYCRQLNIYRCRSQAIFQIVPVDRYNDPINPSTRQRIRAYP